MTDSEVLIPLAIFAASPQGTRSRKPPRCVQPGLISSLHAHRQGAGISFSQTPPEHALRGAGICSNHQLSREWNPDEPAGKTALSSSLVLRSSQTISPPLREPEGQQHGLIPAPLSLHLLIHTCL